MRLRDALGWVVSVSVAAALLGWHRDLVAAGNVGDLDSVVFGTALGAVGATVWFTVAIFRRRK